MNLNFGFRTFLAITVLISSCQGPHDVEPVKATAVALAEGTVPAPATDFASFVQIDVSPDDSVKSMNHVSLGQARRVHLTGVRVELDADREPFRTYVRAKDLAELWIEADVIVIKNALHFYQTNLRLKAETIQFLPGAQLDTTPLKDESIWPAPEVSAVDVAGHDGLTGLPGAQIDLDAVYLLLPPLADKTALLLSARGGPGQDAGLGRAGLAGEGMVPIRTEIHQGTSYGVVFEERFHRHVDDWWSFCFSKNHCAKGILSSADQETPERGTDQYPGDGGRALPGGYPGAGGPGGLIRIHAEFISEGEFSTEQSPSAIVNDQSRLLKRVLLSAGDQGKPANVYPGGAAGQPEFAAKYRTHFQDSDQATRVFEFHQARSGLPGLSPQRSRQNSPAGVLILPQASTTGYSKAFFEERLHWIRELYLAARYKETKTELDKDLRRLLTGGPLTADMSLTGARYSLLRLQLSQQKDYFGHPLNEAPLYSLAFSLRAYQADVQRSVVTMALSGRVLAALKNRAAREALQKAADDQLKETVKAEVEAMTAEQNQIAALQVAFAEQDRQAQVLAQALADLNRQINQLAVKNVNQKQKTELLKNQVRILASIAKVMPVYQPLLASVGTLAEHLLQAPDSGSATDWLQFLAQAQGDLTIVTSPDIWQSSRNDLSRFLTQLKTANWASKSAQEKMEAIKSLYQTWSPAALQLKNLLDSCHGAAVADDEIQQEIQSIKDSDPLFSEVTAQLETYLSIKVSTVNALSEASKALLDSQNKIATALELQISASGQQVDNSRYGDNVLAHYFEELRAGAEDHLLNQLNELMRAYRYLLPGSSMPVVSVAILSEHLKQQIFLDHFSEVSLQEQIDILNGVFEDSVNEVISSLAAQLRSQTGLLRIQTTSAYYELNSSQLEEINRSHRLSLPLTQEFLGSGQVNIRLSKVEIDQADFDFPKSGDPGQANNWIICVTPGEWGLLKGLDGTSTLYHYPPAENVLTWGSRFQVLHGRLLSESILESPVVQSLLGGLLEVQQATSAISQFSEPAALTRLNFDVVGNSVLLQQIKIKALRLKIQYSFTPTL